MLKDNPRWLVFAFISSMLCIMGSLLVPLLSVWFRDQQNSKLVNYGLSLSAGSMLTTALYMMLPEITHENRFNVITGIISGITISLLLNYVVHAFTSESLIHCAHGDEEHNIGHDDDNLESNININKPITEENESAPLLSTSSNNQHLVYTSGNFGKSLINLINSYRPNSTKKCCLLYDCTTTFEPNGKDENDENLPTTSTQTTNHLINTSHSEGKDNDKNKLVLTKSRALSIVCVENTIGYDLENLPIYRKHFYSDKEQFTTSPFEDANNSENEIESSGIAASLRASNEVNTNSANNNKSVECNELARSNSNESVESQDSFEHTTHHENGYYDINEHDNEHNHLLENHNSEHHGHHHFSTSGTPHRPHIQHSHTHPHSINTYTGSLSHTLSHASHDVHRHHMETPFSKLLSIGMQTCIVLTLHKFPEGFIIYYTNQDDTPDSLGFSIFISLAIHNFVEGFAMTLPLYAAFEYKWIAILITAILGGGSQPLGALIGYLMFRNKTSQGQNELQMDFFLSLTAGFLLIIGLQMFQTGVGFSDVHHHHQGENNELMKSNHSSGTTCLKWCCVGVVLVLSSRIFL